MAAREPVEGLREAADRILADPPEPEPEPEAVVTALVSSGDISEPTAIAQVAAPSAARPARRGSIVLVWRPGLTAGVLAVDYRHILVLLTGRSSRGQGVMSCQELAAGLGLERLQVPFF
ncbi:hypothetical protein [Streptomyces mirabilis]|uniref:hypothetical protein n=1 Tax=Streptomyces mirabilis TaxID=68239 RepID=UPI0036DE6129